MIAAHNTTPTGEPRWPLGMRVTKTKGSAWTGQIVGFYSTQLTPEGYAVESENEPGSVQIYPQAALAAAPLPDQHPAAVHNAPPAGEDGWTVWKSGIPVPTGVSHMTHEICIWDGPNTWTPMNWTPDWTCPGYRYRPRKTDV